MTDSQSRPIKILAIDDDEEALFALESILSAEGYSVSTAKNGKDGLAVAEDLYPDLVISDVNMPQMDGFALAEAFKADSELRYIPVLLLTSRDDLEDVVQGLDHGADDYLSKPYQKQELLARLHAALRTRAIYKELWQRKEEHKNLQFRLNSYNQYGDIVGSVPSMRAVYDLIEKVKDSEVPVLISGESGTGKELIAQALHANSNRSDKPFVVQNCAALHEQLLESELFGHVKGAFTGAIRNKPGLFQVANGGTFFLDELGEMSQALQVKLLRVLQDGTFLPVGGTELKRVSVRVVAATNRNLPEMVKAGSFREDLFYRLNVVSISLPPLRERRQDIPLLSEYFLEKICKRQNIKVKFLNQTTLESLSNYEWPGNIRELQNELERLVILSGIEVGITEEYLSAHIRHGKGENARGRRMEGSLKDAVALIESDMIKSALLKCDGNKSEAARILGISRSNLIQKVKAYGLEK